ncbi:MAG: helix-turn-helix transcriptional regulator [Lentisphaeria bacterium]|nr:helix-turn-helix transcriptional regulator [Lentisphaeria bacterium]
MSEITKNPRQIDPVPPPDAEIFLYGRGQVNFSWKFTRKVPFWFLYYNAEPGAVLKFRDRELRPDGRQIILIPPYTSFTSSCDSAFDHIYIHFTVGRPYSQVRPGVMVFDRSVCGTLDLLLKTETPSPAAVYAFLFSVLAAIPEKRFAGRKKPVDDRIQRAMSLLNSGLGNVEICRRIGMSQSNFLRVFRQATGFSPQQYAMELRLEKARCRLGAGELSINEIAADCGFSDRYAFSKAFRKYAGISPGRYRAAARKNEARQTPR